MEEKHIEIRLKGEDTILATLPMRGCHFSMLTGTMEMEKYGRRYNLATNNMVTHLIHSNNLTKETFRELVDEVESVIKKYIDG